MMRDKKKKRALLRRKYLPADVFIERNFTLALCFFPASIRTVAKLFKRIHGTGVLSVYSRVVNSLYIIAVNAKGCVRVCGMIMTNQNKQHERNKEKEKLFIFSNRNKQTNERKRKKERERKKIMVCFISCVDEITSFVQRHHWQRSPPGAPPSACRASRTARGPP